MKKAIFFTTALIICANMTAQLYVNQAGNVGVNMSNPTNISFGLNNNRTRYGMQINGHGEKDLIIHSYSDTVTHQIASKCGLEIHTYLQSGNINNGIQVIPSGSTDYTACAISGSGGNASLQSKGVCGTLTANNSANAGAGIFGSSSNISVVSSAYGKRLWAGFFRGDLYVSGTIYATTVYTPSSSTQSGGTEAETVSVVSEETDAAGESVSDKLGGVRLLRISRAADGNTVYPGMADILAAAANGEELTAEQMARYEEAVRKGMDDVLVPQTRRADVRYGLDAAQLKEAYPGLVCEDDNGNLGINYVEMVPLLVQSLNEQRSEITRLKEEIAELKGEGAQTEPSKKRGAVSGDTSIGTDIIHLGQNKPNPFTDKTSIEVNLPETVRLATLFIYDMSGKQVDKISISDRGKSNVSVSGTSLHEGMYLYSLIADGKVIDTRKMILTR